MCVCRKTFILIPSLRHSLLFSPFLRGDDERCDGKEEKIEIESEIGTYHHQCYEFAIILSTIA